MDPDNRAYGLFWTRYGDHVAIRDDGPAYRRDWRQIRLVGLAVGVFEPPLILLGAWAATAHPGSMAAAAMAYLLWIVVPAYACLSSYPFLRMRGRARLESLAACSASFLIGLVSCVPFGLAELALLRWIGMPVTDLVAAFLR